MQPYQTSTMSNHVLNSCKQQLIQLGCCSILNGHDWRWPYLTLTNKGDISQEHMTTANVIVKLKCTYIQSGHVADNFQCHLFSSFPSLVWWILWIQHYIFHQFCKNETWIKLNVNLRYWRWSHWHFSTATINLLHLQRLYHFPIW